MKVGRHILFWFVYCSYFYIQSIAPQTSEQFSDPVTYRNAFISLYSFIPVCMLSVYVSIYFILPQYIEKKHYSGAILFFLILFSAGTYINSYAAQHFFRSTGVVAWNTRGAFYLGYLNTIWAMIISGIAICLMVTRKWFQQKKEIDEISRIKARNELNLQKNKMHPGFLYSSLDSIYTDIKENRGASSSMILVLSNLLSYSLYESKKESVTLQSELNAVADFIRLERMKTSNEISLEIDDNINIEEILVPPMVILSVLHDRHSKAISISQEDEELIISIVFINQPEIVKRIKIVYKTEYEFA